jgi:TetR/AcrR family transcriptional repressor of nem operon
VGVTAKAVKEGPSTREGILHAAARIIHVKGYTATSIDDVLRESGVGKGNFYYYFRSKEDLGYAILDQTIDAFVSRVLKPCFADADADRIDQIHCFLTRILEAQRQRNCVGGCAMGNLASELSDVHEGFRARLAQVFSGWRARLTDVLTDGQARGQVVATCDPASVAQFLVASIEGAILMAKLAKDIEVMERCVEEMKRYLALYRSSTGRVSWEAQPQASRPSDKERS